MKKLFNRISVILLAIILSASAFSIPVKAASTGNVSIGSASANIGQSVSITVTATVGSGTTEACELWLTYNSTILELVPGGDVNGGGGKIHILSSSTTNSFKINFTAIAAGTSAITLNKDLYNMIGSATDAVDNNAYINAGSGSITVNAPVSASSNCNLSSLQISPGSLTPAFSPDITSYTATVGADCASLTVSATAEDGAAQGVSVTGKRMDTGKNTTKVVVTAQNGATKTYTITTTKEAGAAAPTTAATVPEQTAAVPATEAQTVVAPVYPTVMINNVKYNILSDFSNHTLPDGYAVTETEYNGQKVTAGKGINGLTVMYLEKADGSGEGAFYVYDTAAKTFTLLKTVSEPTLLFTILPITRSMELPEGYTVSTLDIGGKTVDVMIPAGINAKYCLFYGVDEKGNAGWYRYDYTDKTIQKYYSGGAEMVTAAAKTDTTQTVNDKKWMLIAAVSGIAAVILLGVTILLAKKLKSKRPGNYGDNYYDDDDENTISVDSEDAELNSDNKSNKKNTANSSDRNAINESINNAAMYIAAMEAANLEQAKNAENKIVSDNSSPESDTESEDLNDPSFEIDEDILAEIDSEHDSYPNARTLGYDTDNENEISELTDILDYDEKETGFEDDIDDDFEFLDIDAINQEIEDKQSQSEALSEIPGAAIDINNIGFDVKASGETEEPEISELPERDDVEAELEELEILDFEPVAQPAEQAATQAAEQAATQPAEPAESGALEQEEIETNNLELEELEIFDSEELSKEPETNDYEVSISGTDDTGKNADINADINTDINAENDPDGDLDIEVISDESENGDWIY